MGTLHLYCHLSVEAAIAAKSPLAGDLDIPLDENHLLELHDKRFHEIAAEFIGIDHPIQTRNPALAVRRLEVRSSLWPGVIEALTLLAERGTASARAIDRLVKARATPTQAILHAGGKLPGGDIRKLARDVAFLTFEGLPRYVRFEHDRGNDTPARNPLPHTASCSRPPASFEVVDLPLEGELDSVPQSDRMGPLRMAAGRSMSAWDVLGLGVDFTAIEIRRRRHSGRCPECRGEIERDGALVEVTWVGQTLSREYAL